MNQPPVIVWFRQDLRLKDNPALHAAIDTSRPIIPLYIYDNAARPLGGASKWWLHHSLSALAKDLKSAGSQLYILQGSAEKILENVIEKTGAAHIFWNRCYEPETRKRDTNIKQKMDKKGIYAQSFNGNLIVEPHKHLTGSKEPYKVYSPFWKSYMRDGPHPDQPLSAPKNIAGYSGQLASLSLKDLDLLPTKPDWSKGFKDWQPGEAGAQKRLEAFLKNGLKGYKDKRDFPARQEHTSKLSPHLHFGEISPRQIWHACHHYHAAHDDVQERDLHHFLSEVGWREFSYYLLYHWPSLPTKNWRDKFDHFAWVKDKKALHKWQKGQTGYPLVDAGMRELWHTGWMHNRVRMIVASFLIKDLRIHWKEGEEWFWDTLLDADAANNAAGWQWVAGSGADASPYFRVFNPILQSKKFDPNGEYIRKWVPELAKLDNTAIHAPWEASAIELKAAGIELDKTYPRPLVNHQEARNKALQEFKKISG